MFPKLFCCGGLARKPSLFLSGSLFDGPAEAIDGLDVKPGSSSATSTHCESDVPSERAPGGSPRDGDCSSASPSTCSAAPEAAAEAAEAPHIAALRAAWRAAPPEQRPPLAAALAALGVELQVEVETFDASSGALTPTAVLWADLSADDTDEDEALFEKVEAEPSVSQSVKRDAAAVGAEGVGTFTVVVSEGIGKLGLTFDGTAPERVFVSVVRGGSWAEGAGLRIGDEIVALNGKPCTDLTDELFVQEMGVRPLTLRVVRWASLPPSPLSTPPLSPRLALLAEVELEATLHALDNQERRAAVCGAAVAEAAAAAEAELLREQAREAALQGRLVLACERYEAWRRLRTDGTDALLDGLPERRRRLESMRQALSPAGRSGDDWRYFELDVCKLWRCWDATTGNVKVVLQWDSIGSIQKQIMAIRDCDLCEPLWDGESYGMQTQQHGGLTLARWLQKDPLTGRPTEVMLERLLCDCLDDEELPCWMMLERAPPIEGFETFAGSWAGFDIGGAPEGHLRIVTAESGRMLQPVGPDRTLCTMLLNIAVPRYLRWLVTDSLLSWGVNQSTKATTVAWAKIIAGFDTLGFDGRLREHEAFYGPMESRCKEFLATL